MFKINVDSKNCNKKLTKSFSFFKIIVFELVPVNSPYYYENTHSWQSTVNIAFFENEILFAFT